MKSSDEMLQATRAHAWGTVAGVLTSFVVCLILLSIVGFGYGGHMVPVVFWVFFGVPMLVTTFLIIGLLRHLNSEEGLLYKLIYILGAPSIAFGVSFVFPLFFGLHPLQAALPALLGGVANLVAGSIMASAPEVPMSWPSFARGAGQVAMFAVIVAGLVAIYVGSLSGV